MATSYDCAKIDTSQITAQIYGMDERSVKYKMGDTIVLRPAARKKAVLPPLSFYMSSMTYHVLCHSILQQLQAQDFRCIWSLVTRVLII